MEGDQTILLLDYYADRYDLMDMSRRLDELERNFQDSKVAKQNFTTWEANGIRTVVWPEPSTISLSQNSTENLTSHRFELSTRLPEKVVDEGSAKRVIRYAIDELRKTLLLPVYPSHHFARHHLNTESRSMALRVADAVETVVRHANPKWAPHQKIEIYLPFLQYPGRIVAKEGKGKIFAAKVEREILAKCEKACQFNIADGQRRISPVVIPSTGLPTEIPTLDAMEAWKFIGFDPGPDPFLKAALVEKPR